MYSLLLSVFRRLQCVCRFLRIRINQWKWKRKNKHTCTGDNWGYRKGKCNCVSHEGIGRREYLYSSFTSALNSVHDQLHAPATLIPRKTPGTHQRCGCVGSRAALEAVTKALLLPPLGIGPRFPGHPTYSLVTLPTTLFLLTFEETGVLISKAS